MQQKVNVIAVFSLGAEREREGEQSWGLESMLFQLTE